MSWFGRRTPQLATAPGGSGLIVPGIGRQTGRINQIRGARYGMRGLGASRYPQLDHARGKRRGEPPATPPAGRHTPSVAFATETAAGSSMDPRGRPGVVVVAPASDLLAQLVATSLIYAHVPTCQLDPADLDEVELEWHGDVITINGKPITGLLWRTGPEDPSLDSRTTATWLAAASFPSMRAVNAYDPTAWRRGAGWSVWEDRLGECGVPVQPPSERHSASSGTRSLVACGAVVAGPETPCVAAVTDALESSGVRLASVTSLPDGRVTEVNAQPHVDDSIEARRAAVRIADYLAA